MAADRSAASFRDSLAEARRGLVALRLEAPDTVVEDVNQRVREAFASVERELWRLDVMARSEFDTDEAYMREVKSGIYKVRRELQEFVNGR